MDYSIIKIALIKLLLYFKYTSFTIASNKYKIPNSILLQHINNNDIKTIKIFGKKLINLSSLQFFIKNKLNNNYIHNIYVDDQTFKMSFSNYKIDKGIYERILGKREPSTVAILKCLLGLNAKILEIGACYGYFTIIMSKLIGSSGRILSIEGTPNNFQILKNNLKLNNINNVDLENLFVTSKTQNEILFNKNHQNAYNQIHNLEDYTNTENNETNQIKVNSSKISNLLIKKNFEPEFIFMDIEGCEIDVIEDIFLNYKFKYKPIILFEIHHDYYDNTRDYNFIKNFLKKQSYKLIEIDNNLLCRPNE